MKHFDYIFSGGGCAALSLLVRICEDSFFADKRILLIDKSLKQENDRTWCFWEKSAGRFEPVVHHKWQRLSIAGDNYNEIHELSPYEYKMIRGIDFYNYCHGIILGNTNVTILHEEILATGNDDIVPFVKTATGKYTARYVFNSVLFNAAEVRHKLTKKDHYLLQHFKGRLIETDQDVFDPSVGTLMDFRISQNAGTSFVYTLPVSPRKALVEYTLFTADLLQQEQYDAVINDYISNYLNISDYKTEADEFGVIPMTSYKFPTHEGSVINIGTAGGQTKPSSGYTFTFIQKHSALIIELLKAGQFPVREESFSEKKFRWYDRTLLNVLANKKLQGAFVFTELFRKNTITDVFSFLDNETSIGRDLKVISVLPKWVFAKAGLS
ncbi:MAG: lycopene cyclase [Chitinophagaceae bacterium]|nr:MAG: lycopene cyclase [Chitinophagaceae bacterium]